MHIIGPYRLLGAMATCPVGTVWAASDGAGRRVTLAVLEGAAAGDPRWRAAFAATANTLSQADDLPVVGANHAAGTPWVACAAEAGQGAGNIFVALGQQLTAVVQPPVGPAQAEQPTVALASPPSAVPGPASPVATKPVSASPVSASPVSASPVSANPHSATPVSATPGAGGHGASATPGYLTGPAQFPPGGHHPAPVSAPAAPGYPHPTAYPPLPAYPPLSSPGPVRPRRTRQTLVVVLVAVLALVLGAAGGAVAMSTWSGDGADPPVAATPTPSVDIALPDAPTAPGAEPPTGGGWPVDSPRFGAGDQTREITDLAGVGFRFRVPATWSCEPAESTSGYVRYTCGTPAGQGPKVGGDLIVRHCPGPCDDAQRARLRTAEEAWGLQWIRSGPFTTWAETDRVDNQPRYGLIYSSFWRSVPEGVLDRQLVLRMTAPPEQADELRKLTNSVRDVTFTI